MKNMTKQEVGLSVDAAMAATHLAHVYRTVNEWLNSTREVGDEFYDVIVEAVTGMEEKSYGQNLFPTKEFIEILLELNKLERGEHRPEKDNIFFYFRHIRNLIMMKATPAQLFKLEEDIKLWDNEYDGPVDSLDERPGHRHDERDSDEKA